MKRIGSLLAVERSQAITRGLQTRHVSTLTLQFTACILWSTRTDGPIRQRLQAHNRKPKTEPKAIRATMMLCQTRAPRRRRCQRRQRIEKLDHYPPMSVVEKSSRDAEVPSRSKQRNTERREEKKTWILICRLLSPLQPASPPRGRGTR